MTLAEIIKELQGCLAPDSDLDGEIALLKGWRFDPELSATPWVERDGDEHRQPPAYTRDLSLAVGIVPYRWSLSLGFDETHQHAVVTLGRSYPTNATIAREGSADSIAALVVLVVLLAMEWQAAGR